MGWCDKNAKYLDLASFCQNIGFDVPNRCSDEEIYAIWEQVLRIIPDIDFGEDLSNKFAPYPTKYTYTKESK